MASSAVYSGDMDARSGDSLDLGALGRAIARRKVWIILPTLLALAGSIFAVNTLTPRYTGEARLLLEMRDGYYTRPNADRDTAVQTFDTEAVASQVQVMMSRDLARDVIKKVGLVGNSEFDPGVGIFSSFKRVLVILGVVTHPADRSPEDRVLEKYFERLTVYPVAKSRIVAVEFASKDPELAAKTANAIAETYLSTQEAAKKDNARSASTWLSSTIEPLRKKVADSEAKVEVYRNKAGLQVGANNTLIASQQLADISGQIAAARTAQADSQAKAKLLKESLRSGRMFEVPDVANNELIRRLIEQRVNLRAQLALESRTLLSEHPRMKELTAQLSDLESQIRAAAERTVRALENESRIAASRVESLTAALETQRQSVGGANEAEVQLRALEREAKTQRDQLEQLMSKYREAVARDADNASPADARIVSRAIEPTTPSFPKKLPTILISTLAALFLSTTLVASRALLSGEAQFPMPQRSPSGRQEPEFAPERPAPGGAEAEAAPARPSEGVSMDDALKQAEAQFGAGYPQSSKVAGLLTHSGRAEQLGFNAADALGFRAHLVAWLGRTPSGAAPRILAIDAAGADGLMTRHIARELSAAERVVLIDLTDASPLWSIGMSELISGDASVGEVIDREENSRLHVITAGRAGPRPVIAAADLVGLMMQALAETYDRVVLAVTAPQDQVALGNLLRQADGALVIAGHGGNGHAVEVAFRLAEFDKKPIGVVMGNAPGTGSDQPSRKSELVEA